MGRRREELRAAPLKRPGETADIIVPGYSMSLDAQMSESEESMAVVSSRLAGGPSRRFPHALAYTAYAVYRAASTSTLLAREDRVALSAQAVQTLASVPHVALRGTYDPSGYRADTDLLLWLAAPVPDALQDALSAFRQTPLACALEPVWSAFAVHRPADVDKMTPAAYFRGEPALRYLCLCPLTHTAEWHSLQMSGQRRMENDRDRILRQYGEVLVNSVSAAGLGPYDAILALESGDVGQLVDVIRDLGASESRRYIDGPLVAMTGVRKPLGEIVGALP